MSKDVLVVKDLNMHYETLAGDVSAVKNVSFTVKEGESFGLVGESGSGKSTLARIIAGLTPADSGSIKFFEKTMVLVCGSSTLFLLMCGNEQEFLQSFLQDRSNNYYKKGCV